MGNREALLAGAKRCLFEKGYARTTARDIAAASGVSLAAIGYHFGSKEALLNAAMFEVFDSWGAEVAKIGAVADVDDPVDRFEVVWSRLMEVAISNRDVVTASFEALSLATHVPELRQQLAAGQREGWRGLVALVHGIDEDTVDDTMTRTLGAFYSALLSGVAAQWMIDPEDPPTARDFADALRTLTAGRRDTGAL